MKVAFNESTYPYSVQDGDGGAYFIVKVETDEGIYGLGEIGIRELGRGDYGSHQSPL